ncbi:MAG: hypothetical protein KZQ97_13900 [Candidatus Thiodiazotropha sp. (ex Dulcina madagascariensis)]|nr:hypothetical protein [Candidatus Thiodiazotropha sp. (ex Dulcina madagascariensis)]
MKNLINEMELSIVDDALCPVLSANMQIDKPQLVYHLRAIQRVIQINSNTADTPLHINVIFYDNTHLSLLVTMDELTILQAAETDNYVPEDINVIANKSLSLKDANKILGLRGDYGFPFAWPILFLLLMVVFTGLELIPLIIISMFGFFCSIYCVVTYDVTKWLMSSEKKCYQSLNESD